MRERCNLKGPEQSGRRVDEQHRHRKENPISASASVLYPFLGNTNDQLLSVLITYTTMGADSQTVWHFAPRVYTINHHFGLLVRQPVV